MKNQQTQMVPELRFEEFGGDWNESKLGEIAVIRTGPFGSLLHEKDYVDKGTPIITVEHLSDDGLIHKNMPLVSDKDKKRLKSYILSESDIVFSRVGSVDRNSIIKNTEDGWLFSGRILRIRTNQEVINPKFLSYFFQLELTKHRIRSVAVGQTMPSLNTAILRSFNIFFTRSLKEQQNIANFLTAVDQPISLLKQKKAALETYKKGMMQQIFSQEVRFKDENGDNYPDWEEKNLGDVFARSTLKNRDNNVNNVFTNSAIYGIVNQMDFFDHSVANKNNLEGYYIVEKDNFIYNPRISKFAPVGPLKRNKLDSGVMSPLYTVLKNKIGNKTYLEYYFDTTHWHRYMCGIANYGARHDRMNIQNNDLMKMPIPYPCLEEQQKIADCFSSMDQSYNKLKNQIEQTTHFKKGLLQKMFV